MGKNVVVNNTDMRSIRRDIAAHVAMVEAKLIATLQYIGEQSVNIARLRGSYDDITGNLRSSIGYVVLSNGRVVVNGDTQRFSGRKGSGSEGAAAARKLLQELRGEYPDGIVLIVCAGMHYAAYVEDIRHKDVLASAKLIAEQLADRLLTSIIESSNG